MLTPEVTGLARDGVGLSTLHAEYDALLSTVPYVSVIAFDESSDCW